MVHGLTLFNSRICVYTCVYGYTRANFCDFSSFWVWKRVQNFSPPKNHRFPQEVKSWLIIERLQINWLQPLSCILLYLTKAPLLHTYTLPRHSPIPHFLFISAETIRDYYLNYPRLSPTTWGLSVPRCNFKVEHLFSEVSLDFCKRFFNSDCRIEFWHFCLFEANFGEQCGA